MVIGNCGSEYKNNINFGIRILCVQKMQGPVDPCIRKKSMYPNLSSSGAAMHAGAAAHTLHLRTVEGAETVCE